jgi:3-oxoacyl-[acyl-carrier-protein] synthase II
VSGIRPVTRFDTSRLLARSGGEIQDFDPEAMLSPKGLRNLDRSAKLALAASGLALDDAGITHPFSQEDADKFGVVLGTTMGSVWSISEFDKDGLVNGPRSVNPALFPNTVVNASASQISIKFNIQGFNTTVGTGFCSGLDAIFYASNMIRNHGYKAVLAGGVEELCEQTYKGFYKIGHLAGSRQGKVELNCPFDKRRNGIVLGEGSGIVIVEELDHALERGAHIYGEVAGYGTQFDPDSRNIYSPKARGAALAMRSALEDASLEPEEIGYIQSAANSTLDCDVMESRAIKAVFGPRTPSVPVSGIKSMIGETFSASGAMSLCASLGALTENFIPPTINYLTPDRRCQLDVVPNKSRAARIESVLINAFSPTGSNSSLVIQRYV